MMVDATDLKAHRTAASLCEKGVSPRCIGLTKGGMNSKLHAVCCGDGRPLIFLLTAGQFSDYKGAQLRSSLLPDATKRLIADKGYDSDGLRENLVNRSIEPCIPGRVNRKSPTVYDAILYKQRNLIERMFGRLKDWRRIATRYDRSPDIFIGAIYLAASVMLSSTCRI